MEAVALSEDLFDSTQRSDSDSNRQIYFIPYSWWRDAQDSVLGDSDGKRGILYVTSQVSSYAGPMKIINNIFNSDLVFNLKREEHTVHSGENGVVGVSGRDYALVPAEMWVQALRWPNSSNSKVFSEHCPHSALWALDYPRGKDGARLQMRLSYCPAANFFSFLSGELTVTLLGPLVCSEFLFIWSLENNNFSGTVPPELGKLVNLNNLRISSNNFTGRIPDFIQSLKQLQKLGADILLLQQICKHQDGS